MDSENGICPHLFGPWEKEPRQTLNVGHWDLNEILPMKMGSVSVPPLQVPPFTSPGPGCSKLG